MLVSFFNSNFNPNTNTQTPLAQAQAAQALQLLISEAEMGELFKVIALTKNCPTPAEF